MKPLKEGDFVVLNELGVKELSRIGILDEYSGILKVERITNYGLGVRRKSGTNYIDAEHGPLWVKSVGVLDDEIEYI
jgi:hypothetical protein